MNKILSQDEVDALLKSVSIPDLGSPAKAETPESPKPSTVVEAKPQAPPKPAAPQKRVIVYDFRRPDRVPKSLLRSLQLLHDKFCTNVSSSLSAYLRNVTEVSILSVEQITYAEFLLSLSDPTCFNAISMKPLNGLAALEINLDLVFPLIDRLLGGSGQMPKMSRNITEIERNIIQGVVNMITTNLVEAWRPVTEADFRVHASETRPQLLQITSANEVVILFVFEIRLGEAQGNMHLCIPYSVLEPISGKFEQEIHVRRGGDHDGDARKLIGNVLRASVELAAELPPTTISVRDLLSIKTSDIVKLDRKINESVLVRVAGRPKFHGQVTVVNDRKAAKVLGSTDSEV